MFRDLAALGALALVILVPVSARAQSRAPLPHNQTTTAAVKQSPPKPIASRFSRPQLEPKAIEVLKAVGDRLATIHTLSFVSVDMLERPSSQGGPLAQARRSEVTLQRPDKLRVTLSGDGPRSEVYCNGNTMMTYWPAEKALVIAKAPPTISECLKDAYQTSAIDFPFASLIVADANGNRFPNLKYAHYVGELQVAGGANADIVAYSHDNVLVEMWVGVADKLPRVIHVTYLDDPHGLRHNLVFSDWQIDVPVRPEVFTSLTVTSAEHTDSAQSHPVGTSGVQAVPKVPPLTIHTFGGKYWGASTPVADLGATYTNDYWGSLETPPFSGAGYYSSPDGYGYYASGGYYSRAVGYYGTPCSDCGGGVVEDADRPIANFDLTLAPSGWYNAGVAPADNQAAGTRATGQPTYVPGQTMTRLPAGCAAPYTRGAGFYLCGSTWFSGVYGPNGELYYRVISIPGY